MGGGVNVGGRSRLWEFLVREKVGDKSLRIGEDCGLGRYHVSMTGWTLA